MNNDFNKNLFRVRNDTDVSIYTSELVNEQTIVTDSKTSTAKEILKRLPHAASATKSSVVGAGKFVQKYPKAAAMVIAVPIVGPYAIKVLDAAEKYGKEFVNWIKSAPMQDIAWRVGVPIAAVYLAKRTIDNLMDEKDEED
jgi:hypothetical protein